VCTCIQTVPKLGKRQRFSQDMHHMKIKKKDKNLVRTYTTWEEVYKCSKNNIYED
jgi:hypothetical protein